MLVTLERKSYKFMECKSGLYYYDNEYLEICDKVEVTEVYNKDKPQLMINQCCKL